MNGPLDAISATSDNRIAHSPEDELTILRARVEELERESAEREWMDDALKTLAFGTATATGQGFLQQMVRQLSAILQVPYVFVTELVPGRTDRVRTVAGWCRGEAADSVEYALPDSPCEMVFQGGLVFIPCHIQQKFPQDKYLIALNIESYMGAPLLNGAGQPTGHLCVMDVRPFCFDHSQSSTILKIFAERAAAELERLRTEETLRQSEERFRALYGHNPTMYFTLTPDGAVLSVNRFGAEELGYREDELAGQSVLAVFQAVDHHTVLEQLRICSQSPGRTFDWEIQKVRKGGQLLWVKERARAFTGPDGSPIILIVCEDITEQRRTQDRIRDREQQLQATTQLLHTLVHESPLPIVSLDADARVTSWNQAATKLFGWMEEEVLGRELPYVPTGQESEADAIWDRNVRSGTRGPLSLRRHRKDGKLLDLLLWPVCVKDAGGQLKTAIGLYIDQSDLRRAEDARLHSEERLRSFLDALDDLAFELDEHGVYLNVWTRNDDFLLLPGQEIVGKTLDEIHGRETGTYYRAILRRVLDSGTPESIEYSLHLKDHLQHFSAVLSRIPASASTPATVACIVRDVSEKRRSAEALHLSEQHLKSIIETSPECVKLVAADGALLQINPAGLAMIETDNAQDVIGRCVYPLIAESHRDAFRKMNEQVCRGQKKSLELEIVGLRGTRRWIEIHAVPLRNPADGAMVQLGIASDITDRKRTELALRESEERWQRFVADAPVGLVVVGTDKHILSANKAFCALTGYSEQEVINSTYTHYTHPEDLPRNLQLTEEFFAGQRQAYTNEKRYIRKNGEVIWVSVRASQLTVHGHDTPLLLAVVEDITDRKQALADRERISQDLHDNLLQSLYAVGMQLEAGKLLAGKAPRKSKQHVTQAIRQLNHLVLEVRQFITDLTRHTAPTLDFTVALNQLVASCSSETRTATELDLDPTALTVVTPAIGEQLLNIAREALSNSVRHAGATHRSVSLTKTDGSIRLRVADDGKGFAPGRRRGHGLANMAARARTIGAQFTLDSAPDRGTSITIDVPTGDPHAC